MPTKNHFAVLGIDISAGEDDVKKAYRTLAKKWHPDKNKDPGAKEKFQEIAASYEYLSSQDRREMLERELRRAAHAPPPTQQTATTGSYNARPSNTTNNTSSSSKPQPNGPSFTSYSSQSSFTSSSSTKRPDSGTAKPKPKTSSSHWSDSFTKNYRSGKGSKTSSKTDKKHPPNSQASFNKKASGGATYSKPRIYTSSDEDEMFEELFGDFFNANDFGGLSGAKPKTQHRPRDVAPESGVADGLDEEYMFSPRKEEDSTEQLPCPWCGKMFTRGKLGQHEEKCGKFGLSAEEDDDDDDDNDELYDSDDTDGFSYYSSYSKTGGYAGLARKPSWQRKQEETRSKIRHDKKRYKDRIASQGSRNAGYITCPYCQRDFSSEAGVKHMAWCKEHTQRFGRPLNPGPGLGGRSTNNKSDIRGRPSGDHRDSGGGGDRRWSDISPGGTSDYRPGAAGRHRNSSYGLQSDTFGFGPFDDRGDVGPPRTGNDQPFPTHGPKIPDEFDLHGTKVRQYPKRHAARQPSPKVTIGVGQGQRIYVGLSTSPRTSHNSGGATGTYFSAQAGVKPNGAFNVKVNLSHKNAGSYTSAFLNKKKR